MKFTVSTDTLAKGVGVAAPAAASSTTYPYSTFLHLTATADGLLRLLATDNVMALATWIGAVVDEPGEVMLEAAMLKTLVGTFPPGVQLECTLNPKTHVLRMAGLKAGYAANRGGVLPADMPFPVPPVRETTGALALPGAQLVSLLGQVRGAAAQGEDAKNRPLLATIHFKLQANQMLIESADGFRMHRVWVPYTSPKTIDVNLPLSGVSHLIRTLDQAETVYLLFVEREGRVVHVVFIQDSLQITCNSVEGAYPDISAIIPKDPTITVSVASGVFLACLVRAELACDRGHGVRLNLKPGTAGTPGRIEVFTQDGEAAKSHTETLSAAVSAPLDISVNIHYLQALVAADGHPTVQLQLRGAKSPLMISTNSFTGVVMPMAVPPPPAK